MAVTHDLTAEASEAFWLGWLASGLAGALRDLEAVLEDGTPASDPHEVISRLRVTWKHYTASPIAGRLEHLQHDQWAGFVVESATGEAQALRDTYTGAVRALNDTKDYWAEAEACGHPDAPRYVAKLRPFRIRQITKREREDILEDGTPTIDREP